MTTTAPIAASYPPAARFAAFAGLLWSLFGAFQFFVQTFADKAGLIAQGMTPEQAELYAALPAWMAAVFAIGTLGGAIGCVLLLTGRRSAVTMLAVSLGAYVALWVSDALLGVFAVFGTPQVVVLSIVVLVAAGLLWLAQALKAKGVLA